MTIVMLESGKRHPSLETTLRIQKALNVRLEELLSDPVLEYSSTDALPQYENLQMEELTEAERTKILNEVDILYRQ